MQGAPKLAQGNKPAWKLWTSCSTQWRVGMGGAVGLDYLAVEMVAKTLGIRMDRPMLEKLQALEHAQLDRWAETAQRERERARNGR
ncbi:MAG: DUF1799 domain-containing protein [Proteobacteria bacterium]|nr:DUF1799 domain-containing protein [Pseudomonadota bacterium]